MMNDTQANKGWCAHEMGKSISSFEKYVHDGKIPEGIHDQFGHEKKWNKSLIRYFANKKAHIIFPSEVVYVDLGNENLVAGLADGAKNVLRVKSAFKSFIESTISSVAGPAVRGIPVRAGST